MSCFKLEKYICANLTLVGKYFFSKEVLIIKVVSIKNVSVKQQHHYCVLCEAAAATDAKFSSSGLMRTPN